METENEQQTQIDLVDLYVSMSDTIFALAKRVEAIEARQDATDEGVSASLGEIRKAMDGVLAVIRDRQRPPQSPASGLLN